MHSSWCGGKGYKKVVCESRRVRGNGAVCAQKAQVQHPALQGRFVAIHTLDKVSQQINVVWHTRTFSQNLEYFPDVLAYVVALYLSLREGVLRGWWGIHRSSVVDNRFPPPPRQSRENKSYGGIISFARTNGGCFSQLLRKESIFFSEIWMFGCLRLLCHRMCGTCGYVVRIRVGVIFFTNSTSGGQEGVRCVDTKRYFDVVFCFDVYV